jgi:NAD(P)H-binding
MAPVSPSSLLTGATGYVGGRLLGALERGGSPVRCLSRRPEAFAHRAGENTSVLTGDVLDPSSHGAAFAGLRAACHLIHSMGTRASFQRADREGAGELCHRRLAAGVEGIVYLSGLGNGPGAVTTSGEPPGTGCALRSSPGRAAPRSRSSERSSNGCTSSSSRGCTVPKTRPAAPAEPRSPAVGRCASMTSSARPRSTRPSPATSPLQRLLEGGGATRFP